MDFVAIDFETANTSRDSPCAVGLTRVEGGVITAHRVELFRPPVGLDDDLELEEFFDPFCVEIHGITADDVRDKPAFEDLWPELYAEEVRGRLAVAHNASFDMGVLRQAIDRSSLSSSSPVFESWPDIDYICTLVLARRVFSLPSYRLPFVAEAAGVPFDDHHDAGADSRAAAEVLLRMAELRGSHDLADLLVDAGVGVGSIRAVEWHGCRVKRTSAPGGHGGGRELIASAPNPDADPDHPLYGLTLVFTGTLASMTRQQAWDLSASVGAFCEKGVTKHSNVLVMGEQDARRLRPGSTLSSKAKKAFELQAKGQEIEVISEQDFLALTGDVRASGVREVMRRY
jgi:DNA polymerase III epsilon subunit-like protein